MTPDWSTRTTLAVLAALALAAAAGLLAIDAILGGPTPVLAGLAALLAAAAVAAVLRLRCSDYPEAELPCSRADGDGDRRPSTSSNTASS